MWAWHHLQVVDDLCAHGKCVPPLVLGRPRDLSSKSRYHDATYPEVAHKYQIAWKEATSLGAASIMLLFYFGLVLLNMLSQIWVKKGQTSAWCPLQEQLGRGLTSDIVGGIPVRE